MKIYLSTLLFMLFIITNGISHSSVAFCGVPKASTIPYNTYRIEIDVFEQNQKDQSEPLGHMTIIFPGEKQGELFLPPIPVIIKIKVFDIYGNLLIEKQKEITLDVDPSNIILDLGD